MQHKRVWASVERDAQTVIDDLFEEAVRRGPHPERQGVVLVDGERERLQSAEAQLKLRSLRSSGDFEAY